MADRSLPPGSPGDEPGFLPERYRAQPPGPIGPPPPAVDEGESMELGRYLSALGRHKLLILFMLSLGVGAGFLVYQFLSPTYQSEATVWIEQGPGTQGTASEPIRSRQLLESYSWIDLMRSYVVLDPVVRELALYVSPREPEDLPVLAGFDLGETFETGRYRLDVSEDGREITLRSPRRGAEDFVERVPVGSEVGREVGFIWTPPVAELTPGRSVEFSVSRPRDAARRLARDLDVQIEGAFLRVTLEGTDPERITRIVNSAVGRYVDVAEQLKRAQLDELTEILEEQLAYAEDNLRQAELQLQNFQVQTISLPSNQATPVAPGLEQTRDPVFSNFFSLKLQQEEIRRDRLAIERALQAAAGDARLRTEAFEVIPAVRESSDIMQALQLATEKRADLRVLRLRYTDEHPDVRRLTEDLRALEEETIPGLLTNLVNEIGSRQDQLDEFVGQASQELQQIPPRAVEEARLERRFAGAEDLFNELQGRFEAARLAAASTIADVRVLDVAQTPSFPSSDPRGRFFALAALAGLGLGLLGAVLRDRADPRLRYPDQVTRELGLPILAAIPHVRGRNGGLRPGDHEQVVESFRNLRLAMTYAHGGSGPLVTTVTSPGIGDGKSFCTSNLALAFGELGHRTIIVDGDVRRGTMHTLFARARKPGLTDYLAGKATLDDVIQDTEHPSLSVIASGSRFQDGPELLGTPEMQQLVEELRARYAVTLIDSPPMGAAVDPYLLATMAGTLLVVLRNGMTDRDFAGAKLSDLTRLPVNILGAVLNDVPTDTGPYRYYSYLPGYGVGDEDADAEARPALAGRR